MRASLAAALIFFTVMPARAQASPAPASSSADALTLRVLTFNVWGVPWITPELEARMRSLPAAIAEQAADLVLLQELWEPAHAEALARALRAHGYGHSLHWARPGRAQTGLFAASKWPLRSLGFQRFAECRFPHSFWHLDWLVRKGVANFWLETPFGRVLVQNTHLQAQYRTDRYEAERLSQACELWLANPAHREAALILGGDFNSSGGESPRRALAGLGRLLDAHPSGNEDTIYSRSGGGLSLRAVEARSVLEQARRLENGTRLALSDHRALLVTFELKRCSECTGAFAADATTLRSTTAELQRAAGTTQGRVGLSLFAALSCAGSTVYLRRRARGGCSRARSPKLLFRAGTALLALGFVWSFYLAAVYYPTRGQVLQRILRAIEVQQKRG